MSENPVPVVTIKEEKIDEPIKKESSVPKKEKFMCSDCGLTEDVDYYGRKPPFCRSVVFLEDSYISRDPFSPQASNNANFLLLGSKCAICKEMTCQECSVFYSHRLCAKCSKVAAPFLPQQLKISQSNNKD